MNNERLLTVKQVANKLQISTQAVYKQLQTKYQKYVVVKDNQKLVKISILDEFKPVDKQLTTELQEVDNPLQIKLINELQEEVAFLKSEIVDYKAKIESLEQLRAEQDKHLQELHNQLLQIISQQNVLLLNTQRLSAPAEKQEIESSECKSAGDDGAERKGLFGRLFIKRK